MEHAHDYFVRVCIKYPSVTVDCGPPTLAANVVVEPSLPNNTTFGSTFSFRCVEGLFPNTTHEAVCGADGQWRPDPANQTCRNVSGKLMSYWAVVTSSKHPIDCLYRDLKFRSLLVHILLHVYVQIVSCFPFGSEFSVNLFRCTVSLLLLS